MWVPDHLQGIKVQGLNERILGPNGILWTHILIETLGEQTTWLTFGATIGHQRLLSKSHRPS